MENNYFIYKNEDGSFIPTDIVGAAFNIGLKKVLVRSEELPADFFDLSTKLAGEVIQKSANYGIQTAIVLDPGTDHGDRFRELVLESENNSIVRFFYDESEAVAWLK